MDQITRIASDLNESTDNRYKLVYEIAEIAKKLVEETIHDKVQENYDYDGSAFSGSSSKKEKPVQHAIMVKSSETNDSGFVG